MKSCFILYSLDNTPGRPRDVSFDLASVVILLVAVGEPLNVKSY